MAFGNWLPTVWDDRRESDPFRALRKEIDELFEDWGAGRYKLPALGGKGALAVRIDVSESDKDIQVVADLPGMSEKDIKVTLVGDQLTISGERKSEVEEKPDGGRRYHRIERSWGSFMRTMTLPFRADPDQVNAQFKNGVLTVTVPKPAEIKAQSREIKIKSAN
jgi:HSP20 family protein